MSLEPEPRTKLSRILFRGFEAGHMTYEEMMVILVCVHEVQEEQLVSSMQPTHFNLLRDRSGE